MGTQRSRQKQNTSRSGANITGRNGDLSKQKGETKMVEERKLVYPALFTFTEDIILVEVPDFGILTEGNDFYDAIQMARDAIKLAGASMEESESIIPEPSEFLDVTDGTFAGKGVTILSYVDVKLDKYNI